MTDDRARLFDFFLGKAGCNAHLQGGEQNLLGLKVVFESLQSCNEDAIGKTLVHC